VNQRDIPVATSLCVVLQQVGPAVSVFAAQAAFLNRLLPKMKTINPDLTAKAIVQAGAIGLKELVPDDLLPKVIAAYADSIGIVSIVAAALAVAAVILAGPIPWKNIRKIK
jgi:hypothetical protein